MALVEYTYTHTHIHILYILLQVVRSRQRKPRPSKIRRWRRWRIVPLASNKISVIHHHAYPELRNKIIVPFGPSLLNLSVQKGILNNMSVQKGRSGNVIGFLKLLQISFQKEFSFQKHRVTKLKSSNRQSGHVSEFLEKDKIFVRRNSVFEQIRGCLVSKWYLGAAHYISDVNSLLIWFINNLFPYVLFEETFTSTNDWLSGSTFQNFDKGMKAVIEEQLTSRAANAESKSLVILKSSDKKEHKPSNKGDSKTW